MTCWECKQTGTKQAPVSDEIELSEGKTIGEFSKQSSMYHILILLQLSQ